MNLKTDGKNMKIVIDYINKLPKDKKYDLLDIGSADKHLKGYLPNNIIYYSLDIKGEHDYLHDLDTFPIPIEDNKFDLVVCLETLEHLCYPYKVMEEIKRIAKDDATFFLSMPNEYNFYCRFNFLIGKKTSVQEPFYVVEKHRHIHLPRTKDITTFFGEHIEINEVYYNWYSRKSAHGNPLTKKFFRFIDLFIQPMAEIFPSTFSRSVIVIGGRENE